MRRPLLPRLVLVAAVATTTTAWAVISSVTVSPQPVILGMAYSIKTDEKDNTDPVKSYQWERRTSIVGCPSEWVNADTDNTYDGVTPFPASYQHKVTIAYKKLGPNHTPPAPNTVPAFFSVSAADSVAVIDGTGTPTPNGQKIVLRYRVKSGGVDCGAYIGGVAQERITNWVDVEGPLPDSDWGPAVPSPVFALQQNTIADEHLENRDPVLWNSLLPGTTLTSATQELRIIYDDGCGQQIQQPLGSKQISHTKITATEWELHVN